MPPARTKKATAKAATPVDCEDTIQNADENLVDSQPSSSAEEDMPTTSKVAKKRGYEEAEEEGQSANFGGEMQKMLECFGADISKTLVAKRKRLENYTQTSLKTQNRKVEDIWKGQQVERQRLGEEFRKQVAAVFQQWESDLDKSKDQEEKLQSLFRQQQKLFQQTRVVQSQRLKTIKQLHEQYLKGIGDLERVHGEQQGSVQGELKKEMGLLQKRILMDTQQQEMANVRKSLQTMLF